MTKEEIIEKLGKTQSDHEWNAICSQVKTENGGYPGWWYATVVLGGMTAKAAMRHAIAQKRGL